MVGKDLKLGFANRLPRSKEKILRTNAHLLNEDPAIASSTGIKK